MVKIWYKLVSSGKWKIEDVPVKYREQVRILVEASK